MDDRITRDASGEATLGLVLLETRFPRLPGDVGHPGTFSVPVRRLVVPGAVPRQVVTSARALREGGLAARFASAVRALAAGGANVVTTSCGFLVLLQGDLQAVTPIPVVTSSLLLLPGLLAREPKIGVLTIDAASLGAEHLRAAGVPETRMDDVLIQGVEPDGEFATAILGNREHIDFAQARADVVEAARMLRARDGRLQTVVLECTNMPPFAKEVRGATGFEVLSLLDVPEIRPFVAGPG